MGPRMIFFWPGWRSPNMKGKNFQGETMQYNIGRENVALRHGCGIPAAE